MQPQDMMLDDNDDLLITDGDFDVDDTNECDAELLIMTAPGNWKQSPLCGFGLPGYMSADLGKQSLNAIEKGIISQLAADGFQSPDATILLSGNNIVGIQIDGDRQLPDNPITQ